MASCVVDASIWFMFEETSGDLVPNATSAIERFSSGLSTFLGSMGLPTNDVLTEPEERGVVFNALPVLVSKLPDSQLAQATYLSKFVAACGAGLFDAALNYIWDEVVLRLRQRVARFDLNYFFDTAIKDAEARKQFKDEEDLQRMSDSDLIAGALSCGLITPLAYKHLDYIRDIRNWASAAHPNSAQLTGLQLASYCETCIKEAILKELDGAALEVGRLLNNLRAHSLSKDDAPAIVASVRRLPEPLVSALLRSVAGHYCDPRLDVRVRDNLKLIAPDVWNASPDSARGEIGIRYSSYSANADLDRKKLAHEFLDLVDGLTYLPESERALEVSQAVQQLEQTHDGWDNYYNEPPAARKLRKYIGDDGVVPDQVNAEYVKVVTRCRIGRTCGIARAAVSTYDEMIDLFQEPQVRAFLGALSDLRTSTRLDNKECAGRFREVARKLLQKTVDRPLIRALQAALDATDAQLPSLASTTAFQRILADLG